MNLSYEFLGGGAGLTRKGCGIHWYQTRSQNYQASLSVLKSRLVPVGSFTAPKVVTKLFTVLFTL